MIDKFLELNKAKEDYFNENILPLIKKGVKIIFGDYAYDYYSNVMCANGFSVHCNYPTPGIGININFPFSCFESEETFISFCNDFANKRNESEKTRILNEKKVIDYAKSLGIEASIYMNTVSFNRVSPPLLSNLPYHPLGHY